MTATIIDSIEDKYNPSLSGSEDENAENFDFIVYVSNSPETKKGMYPPIMTLIDYDIQTVGTLDACTRLNHIAELDLTDNLLSDWPEVLLLLKTFSGLEFLNLSNNILSEPMERSLIEDRTKAFSRNPLPMRKLVLNGNKLDWSSVHALTSFMPQLEELHLSTNDLTNPEPGVFSHPHLRQLFLSCNPLTSFEMLSENLSCPELEMLSLSECPVESIPDKCSLNKLICLNLSTTRVSNWSELDKLSKFSSLRELRLQHIPLLHEYTAHEKRMLLISRLPNVKILNGGDVIPPNEREDAERAFIRFYLNEPEKPQRYHELVQVHGELDPLVNIDMRPDKHVRVQICHNEVSRTEIIKVYQTVQQFKQQLHRWFSVPTQNMKLYYCDQDLVEIAGPEEMKWPQKDLYTYNVQNGDKFILDEKVPLSRIRTNSRSSLSSSLGSPGNKHALDPPKHHISFNLTPKPGQLGPNLIPKPGQNMGSKIGQNTAKSPKVNTAKSNVPRNLAGKHNK